MFGLPVQLSIWLRSPLCILFPFSISIRFNQFVMSHCIGCLLIFRFRSCLPRPSSQRAARLSIRTSFRCTPGVAACPSTDNVLCAVSFGAFDIVDAVARSSVAVKWPTHSVCAHHIDRVLSSDRRRLQRSPLVAAAAQQMHTVHGVRCQPIDRAATVPIALGHRVRNT